MHTKKISGKDAETLFEILERNGITLSDDQPAIRLWRRVDKGKRLFVRLDSQKPKTFDNEVESA